MSFSADWLALRSDADRAARNADVAAELAVAMDDHDALRVLDLGAGTGATLEALSPILPASQTWVLADNDAELLARVVPPEGITVETRQVDLATGLKALFDPAPDLVTASAFFDLCGADLADRIVALAVEAGAAFYAALSYDGRQEWHPENPLDEAVVAAFNADQRRDKGLGPALGPDAADHLATAFRAHGYSVTVGQSDWRLTAAEDAPLIAELSRGTADALASALGGATAQAWHAARAKAEAAKIGHHDVLALPPGEGT